MCADSWSGTRSYHEALRDFVNTTSEWKKRILMVVDLFVCMPPFIEVKCYNRYKKESTQRNIW